MSDEQMPDSPPDLRPAEPGSNARDDRDDQDDRPVVLPPPSGIDLAKALLAQARADSKDNGRRRAERRAVRTGDLDGQRRSGAAPDDRDPQTLARNVERLVDERGWQVPVAVGSVVARWPQVVGSELADHCVPDHYADTVLTVRADSTAWATQVRLLAPNLVARLNEECGQGTVTQVKVLGPGRPSWRRGPWHVSGRGPRDTYG